MGNGLLKFVIVVLTCCLAILPVNAQSAETVNIGAVLPLSGPLADSGQDFQRSFEVAVELWNSKGGFRSMNGAQARIVFSDAQSKADVARLAAEQFALSPGISALLGPVYSPLAVAMGAIAERYGIPHVMGAAIEDALTNEDYRYIFRVGATATAFGRTMSEFALQEIKPAKVALVYADSVSYRTTMDVVRSLMTENGVRVVLDEPYDPATTNFVPLAQRVARSAPDVLMVGSYDRDAVLLTRALRQQNVRVAAIVAAGGGFTTVDYLEAAGQLSENVTSVAIRNVDDPRALSAEFTQAYLDRYGDLPKQINASGYMAATFLLHAIEAAGSRDRDAIAEALRSVEVETIDGPIRMDRRGEGNPPLRIVQVQDGEFVTVWPADLASAELRTP